MHKHVESALKAAPLNEYEYLICIPLKRASLGLLTVHLFI